MISIIKFYPMDKGALRGFLTIEVKKWGLIIHDLSVFESGGRRWINFPSKKVDAKEQGEKPTYLQYLRFADKEVGERFNAAVWQALDEHMKTHANQPQHSNHNDSLPF